jgi:hypothetical protein
MKNLLAPVPFSVTFGPCGPRGATLFSVGGSANDMTRFSWSANGDWTCWSGVSWCLANGTLTANE